MIEQTPKPVKSPLIRRKTYRQEYGATIIETALVVSLVMAIVVSIIELGMLFFRYAVISHIATVVVRQVGVDTAGLTNETTTPEFKLIPPPSATVQGNCQSLINRYAENKARMLYQSLLAAPWPESAPPVAHVEIRSNIHQVSATKSVTVRVPTLVLEANIPFQCMLCRLLPSTITMSVRVESTIEDECFNGSVCLPPP